MLADLSWNGTVKGINQIQAEEVRKYGPGDYVPIVGITYWTFRLMVGAGVLMMLLTIGGLMLMRRRKLETAKWFQRAAIIGIFLPILANWTGWIFTEIGPATLGRVRVADDQQGELAERRERGHHPDARRLHRHLRNPDRGWWLADAA